MPFHDLKVVLKVLPCDSQQVFTISSQNQLAIGDDIFIFDDILDSNHNDLVDMITNQLAHGNHVSLVYHDTYDRFDSNILLGLDSLFKTSQNVYVKFTEYDDQQAQTDLISPDNTQNEYRIDAIDLAEKYYQFGLSQHTIGSVSIFSILVKDTDAQFNLVNISHCSNHIMDQFFTFCTQGSQQHNIWLYELEHSSSIIYLNYIHPSDNLAQLKHTLDYASSLSQHKSTAHTTKSVLSSDENLHRIISRLSNEIQMLKQQKGRESTSTYSEGPRNISMFSSVSNSTSATILTDEKFDHDIHDLHRQIEELENQVTVTRERNTLVEQELVDISNNNQRLCKINDTQAQLLDGLEQKITETENLVQILSRQLVAERSLYAEHYAPDKRELEDCLKVIQQLVSKQEEQHSHAIEELIIIQKWLASKNDALIEEDVFDTYLDHIPEEQDWKQAFQQLQQKTLVLERKLVETEADLDVCRQAIRNNDNSGLVGKLENDIARLETVQDSTAVNQHIEHLESVVQNLNQQLLDATHRSMEKDRQIASLQQQQQQYDTKHKSNELTVSRHRRTLSNQTTRSNNPQAEQAQLMRWIYENIDDPTGRSEVIQKFSQMSDDNAQLSMWIHDLEAQLFSERQRMAQENKSLECEVMNLALQLEKEPVKRRSRSSTQSKLERSSVLSAAEQRSRSPISSFPPPPTEPPSEPLPPVPAPSSSKKQSRVSDIVSQLESSQSKVQAQQQELTAHHGELDALKKQLENISLELENERKLKQKAEKAHQILERRIEDLMTNKKNKFRCF